MYGDPCHPLLRQDGENVRRKNAIKMIKYRVKLRSLYRNSLPSMSRIIIQQSCAP